MRDGMGAGEPMVIASCRDCANFEDRRDIDGVALCARNAGPYVCGDDFQPKHETMKPDRPSNRIHCLMFGLEVVTTHT